MTVVSSHSNLLQHLFSALFLGGKAGNCPHFDFNAVVKLFPPHVPHSLVGSSYGTVLKRKGGDLERTHSESTELYTCLRCILLLLKDTNARTMSYPSSILQDRSWKDSPCHLSHVIFHLDPKLLDVRVQVEVGILHLWRVKNIHHVSQTSECHTCLHIIE